MRRQEWYEAWSIATRRGVSDAQFSTMFNLHPKYVAELRRVDGIYRLDREKWFQEDGLRRHEVIVHRLGPYSYAILVLLIVLELSRWWLDFVFQRCIQ